MQRAEVAVRTPRRSPALDVLRGIAALAVLFGHTGLLAAAAHAERSGVVRFLAANGWKGIFLFFAISGYLISRPFVRAATGTGQPPTMRNYARRRAARILPAHWLALTVMALVIVVDSGADPQDLTGPRYVAHMFLVQNLVPGVAHTILPVTWTLGIEALFYVMVPIGYWCATRHGRVVITRAHVLVGLTAAWLLGAGVLLAAAQIAELPATPLSFIVDNLLTPTIGYLVYFVPGIAVAALEAGDDAGHRSVVMDFARRHARHLLVVAVLLWLGAGLLVTSSLDGNPAFAPWWLSAAMPLIESSFGGVAVLAVVAAPPVPLPRHLVAIGESSYGIYLWHWIVINVVFWGSIRLGVPTGIWASQPIDAVVVASLTFGIGWASWRWVELPAMAWARRRERVAPWIDRPSAAMTSPSPASAEASLDRRSHGVPSAVVEPTG